MADTYSSSLWSTLASAPLVEVAPRGASDYCREMAGFLRANPDAWTRGVIARGGDDTPVDDPGHLWARKWCALGLVARFVSDMKMREIVIQRLMRAITPLQGAPVEVHAYNDNHTTTVEDIIAMFECAALMPPDFAELQERARAAQPKIEANVVAFEEQPVLYGFGEAKLIKVPAWETFMFPLKGDFIAEADKATEEMAKKLVPWDKIMAQIKAAA